MQYTSDDISDYFSYAKNYTVCDRYFSEVAGPSTPNHLMLICADAPVINNPRHQYNPRPGQGYNLPSLPAQLERAGLQWGNYGGYAFHYINELAGHRGNHTRDLFMHDALSGRLPAVSWVYGDGRPDLSEHPSQNITDGMRWTVEQVNAIVKGRLWKKQRSSLPGTTGVAGSTMSTRPWSKDGTARMRNVRQTRTRNSMAIRSATALEFPAWY